MDPSSIGVWAAVFFGLLLLSAFFSGSETAFFSLSNSQLRHLRGKDDSRARRVLKLLDRPRDLLIAILVGNTVVNTAAASIAAIAAYRTAVSAGFSPAVAVLIQIVLVTFVLIILVEVTPKVVALKNNESWALTFASSIRLVMFLLWPVTKLLVLFVESVARALGVESRRVLFNEEELRTLAEVAEEHGALEEEEREMIHSIFEFGETEVREVMVPRIDMVTLPEDATLEEASEIVRSKGHSRIPVYREDIDHISGILYAKDLIGTGGDHKTIADLLREAYFVPESKRISSLLKEFQLHKIHMAIVVDEYGGTEGLVTMEDVIEEIVGEIQDEYDSEEPLVTAMEKGLWRVLAKIETDEFNRLAGEDLVPTEEGYETLGGFIFNLAGEVPAPGAAFEHEGWTFTVEGVEGNRVVTLVVRPPEGSGLAVGGEEAGGTSPAEGTS